MQTQKIVFRNQTALSVFPEKISNLAQSISELKLNKGYPVIVLIGGAIDDHEADLTLRAVEIICKVAEEKQALVICGGTDMGVMAEVGQVRSKSGYNFPLIGIAPKNLVAWPGGRRSTKFLWWGKKRWNLESHHSHFILVPGDQFGDESPWIFDAATILSKGHRSVTILINGGEISRKDVELSLQGSRPVIVLSRTGRLADDLSKLANPNKLITVVEATVGQQIMDVINAALIQNEESVVVRPITL